MAGKKQLPYKLICISIYHADLALLDALVACEKAKRPHDNVSRSKVVREMTRERADGVLAELHAAVLDRQKNDGCLSARELDQREMADHRLARAMSAAAAVL